VSRDLDRTLRCLQWALGFLVVALVAKLVVAIMTLVDLYNQGE